MIYIYDINEKIEENDSNFVTTIPSVCSKYDLLRLLNSKLFFPYFGFNWDALAEMYRDFWWIENVNIHIIHEGICNLPPKDLSVYFFIIQVCVDFWENYPEHKVYFYMKRSEIEMFKIWKKSRDQRNDIGMVL